MVNLVSQHREDFASASLQFLWLFSVHKAAASAFSALSSWDKIQRHSLTNMACIWIYFKLNRNILSPDHRAGSLVNLLAGSGYVLFARSLLAEESKIIMTGLDQVLWFRYYPFLEHVHLASQELVRTYIEIGSLQRAFLKISL